MKVYSDFIAQISMTKILSNISNGVWWSHVLQGYIFLGPKDDWHNASILHLITQENLFSLELENWPNIKYIFLCLEGLLTSIKSSNENLNESLNHHPLNMGNAVKLNQISK